MGYIYIIKNTVNNKVYIGQTSRTIKKRFSEHTSNLRLNTKLAVAMRELGTDKFYIQELAECSDSDLNKLEIEYIYPDIILLLMDIIQHWVGSEEY